MKKILALLFVFIAASSFALNIITRDGKGYWDATVKAVERDGIRITHRDGVAYLDFDELPYPLQQKYGWTEEKSAVRKAARAVEAERQRLAAENARRATEERRAAIKAQLAANTEEQRQSQAKNAQTGTNQSPQNRDDDEWSPLIIGLLTIVAIIMIVAFLVRRLRNAARNKRIRALEISHIDCMSGIEFELYLQQLLTARGFHVSTTPISGDLGVDLVASSGGNKFAIQVKRYSDKVSRLAISDVVSHRPHHSAAIRLQEHHGLLSEKFGRIGVVSGHGWCWFWFAPSCSSFGRAPATPSGGRSGMRRWLLMTKNYIAECPD